MSTRFLFTNFVIFNRKIRISQLHHYKRTFANRAYVHRVGVEPLIYKNLGETFLESCNRYGDRRALISREENLRMTYGESLIKAQNLAYQLKELGLQRGEHLGIWAPNTSHWFVTFIAAALGGYPLVCLNSALQAPELEFALKKAKIKVLITIDEYGKLQFSNILNKLLTFNVTDFTDLRFVIMKNKNIENSNIKILDFDYLLNKPTNAQCISQNNDQLGDISPESACNLLFTSGTTGNPKAAVLTHFNVINEAYHFSKSLLLNQSLKSICLTVPLFHVFGLAVALSAFFSGSTLVIPKATFNADAAIDAIEGEKCDIILGTPTMFVDMLEKQMQRPRVIDSLKLGLVGGAACSPEILSQAKQKFKLEEMRIAYGLTESTAAIFCQDGTEPFDQAQNTVGKIYEHLEAKVINDLGETVAFGEQGELCVRGFTVMKGYYEDNAKTSEVLGSDGWLRVGDEFVLEPSGIGRIMGRKKEMILRGGENIYPKEIENILDTHPNILEAQVIGVPDKRLGEEVCAYLRQKSSSNPLTENDIQNFLNGKLAYFKIPRYVRFVEDFPKTATGKIQKFKLKEIFVNESRNN